MHFSSELSLGFFYHWIIQSTLLFHGRFAQFSLSILHLIFFWLSFHSFSIFYLFSILSLHFYSLTLLVNLTHPSLFNPPVHFILFYTFATLPFLSSLPFLSEFLTTLVFPLRIYPSLTPSFLFLFSIPEFLPSKGSYLSLSAAFTLLMIPDCTFSSLRFCGIDSYSGILLCSLGVFSPPPNCVRNVQLQTSLSNSSFLSSFFPTWGVKPLTVWDNITLPFPAPRFLFSFHFPFVAWAVLYFPDFLRDSFSLPACI